MKSKKIVAAILTLTLTAGCLLVGCGDTKKSAEKSGGASAEIALDKDQVFNFRSPSDPRTGDISLNYEETGGYIINSNSELLTRKSVDEKGNFKIVPAGAESWKISDDGLTYTFKIRDMKWDDDKPITAKDYEYSIKRTINPKTGAAYGGMFSMLKNAAAANKGKANLDDVGIKALDDKTLEFKLDKPCPYFLGLTSFYTFAPQRQDLVEKFGDKYGTEANTMFSSGPFVLKEWVHNNKLTFVKNEKYWDAKNIKLQTLNIYIIKEETAALTQLTNGELDYADTTDKDWIEKIKKNDKLQTNVVSRPTERFMFLNKEAVVNGVKLFSNQKIRQALTLAFDRKEVANVVGEGLGVESVGLVPDGIHSGDKEYRKEASAPLTKLKEKNPDVKKLITEGLKELGADPDPSKYAVTLLYGSTSAKAKQFGEYYQQVIEKNTGFKFKLDFVESSVRTKRTQAGDYVMSYAGWNPDYDDPNTFMDLWLSGNKSYPTGWNNSKYDELIDKASKELDTAKRIKIFEEAETLLVEEAYVIPLYADGRAKFLRKGVKGFVDIEIGGGKDFRNIYMQGKQK